tara:strand:- start:2622 stop:3278 length:657 start_codon:yes stop_codon:yes gene_type:complete
MVKLLAIEATIGAGKSTQLELLRALFKDEIKSGEVILLEEPVQKWMDRGLLQAFYLGELSKATFQFVVLMSLAGPLIKAFYKAPKLIISERSPYSNFHTFAKLNLDPKDLNAYSFTFDELMSSMDQNELELHMMYLKVTPQTAIGRVASRDRDSEGQIQLAYMQALHAVHEKLGENANPHKFYVVDGERSVEDVSSCVTAIATSLLGDDHNSSRIALV